MKRRFVVRTCAACSSHNASAFEEGGFTEMTCSIGSDAAHPRARRKRKEKRWLFARSASRKAVARRGLTEVETRKYERLNGEIDGLGTEIDRLVAAQPRGLTMEEAAALATGTSRGRRDDEIVVLRPTERLSEVIRGEGRDGSFGRIMQAMATGNRKRLSDFEARALSEGTDASGGYAVPDVLGARIAQR
jgi:HK97 family phage major capsid protein